MTAHASCSLRAVDIRATELCTTPSGYIAGWNTSVQSWLKVYVYRPLPKGTPRAARQLIVFLVSAFWHGIHPGYYLCFAGMFAMVNVEQLARAAFAPLLPPWVTHGVGGVLLAFACHVWTMACFCFTGIAFNKLSWGGVLDAWASFHYYGVWLTAVPAVVAALVLLTARPRKPSSQGDRRGATNKAIGDVAGGATGVTGKGRRPRTPSQRARSPVASASASRKPARRSRSRSRPRP